MKKYIPLLIIVFISLCSWMLGLHHYLSLDTLRTHHAELEMFTAHNYLLAIILYIIFYMIVVAFSLPVAALLTIASGFLFGQVSGTITAVIGATLGASVLFLSAKHASKNALKEKAGSWMAKMQKGFLDNAFFYLLTLRLIPLFPFVAVNVAAALFQIPWRTFFLGTFMGIIPGSFVYVSFGVALRDVIQTKDVTPSVILSPTVLVAFGGLGILSLLPVLYKHFHREAPQSLAKPDTPGPSS